MDDFTIRQPLTLMLFKLSRRCNLPDRNQSQNSAGDNVESGIASIDRSDATLSDEFPCPDDYFDAPWDQIHCVLSLNHDVIKIFDPYPAEIPFNVQIMSRILEDQQMLPFNCLGDFFHEITIS
jgi:hypothetical protein